MDIIHEIIWFLGICTFVGLFLSLLFLFLIGLFIIIRKISDFIIRPPDKN